MEITNIDQEITDLFSKAKSIVIVSHIRPDGDAIGSMLGLANALRLAGKDVQTVLQDPVPERFINLPGANLVGNLIKGNPDLAVVVDSSDPNRVGNVFGSRKPDLVIDHHMTNLNFGKLNLVDSDAEATAIILAKRLPIWGLSIDKAVAECLLTAILTDTIGFRTISVNPDSLRIAASLMEKGADLHTLYYQSLLGRTASELRYWGQGLQDLQLVDGLLWASLSLADRQKAGYFEDDDAELINELANTNGALISLIFVEQRGGSTKVSWRSKEGIDVSKIAYSFGGGGHMAASGADIKGSMEEVRARVLERTREVLDQNISIKTGE